MRAKLARRLRREIYGTDLSPRARKYFVGDPKKMRLPKCLAGCCIADARRRAYQAIKKAYKRGEVRI